MSEKAFFSARETCPDIQNTYTSPVGRDDLKTRIYSKQRQLSIYKERYSSVTLKHGYNFDKEDSKRNLETIRKSKLQTHGSYANNECLKSDQQDNTNDSRDLSTSKLKSYNKNRRGGSLGNYIFEISNNNKTENARKNDKNKSHKDLKERLADYKKRYYGNSMSGNIYNADDNLTKSRNCNSQNTVINDQLMKLINTKNFDTNTNCDNDSDNINIKISNCDVDNNGNITDTHNKNMVNTPTNNKHLKVQDFMKTIKEKIDKSSKNTFSKKIKFFGSLNSPKEQQLQPNQEENKPVKDYNLEKGYKAGLGNSKFLSINTNDLMNCKTIKSKVDPKLNQATVESSTSNPAKPYQKFLSIDEETTQQNPILKKSLSNNQNQQAHLIQQLSSKYSKPPTPKDHKIISDRNTKKPLIDKNSSKTANKDTRNQFLTKVNTEPSENLNNLLLGYSDNRFDTLNMFNNGEKAHTSNDKNRYPLTIISNQSNTKYDAGNSSEEDEIEEPNKISFKEQSNNLVTNRGTGEKPPVNFSVAETNDDKSVIDIHQFINNNVHENFRDDVESRLTNSITHQRPLSFVGSIDYNSKPNQNYQDNQSAIRFAQNYPLAEKTSNNCFRSSSLSNPNTNLENLEDFLHNKKTERIVNPKLPQKHKNPTSKIAKSKTSSQQNGAAYAYAVNTYKGDQSEENQDRAAIFFNMVDMSGNTNINSSQKNLYNPNSKKELTPFSFFGLYQGFGGNGCANYMKDNLHKFIIESKLFPKNITKAIREACIKADYEFINKAIYKMPIDASGCTAVIFLILDKIGYMIHVGNSKLIISRNNGTLFREMGTNFSSKTSEGAPPHFGDFKAKINKFGKIPKTAYPLADLQICQLDRDMDFLFMGSDHFYKSLKTKEVEEVLWKNLRKNLKAGDAQHQVCGNTVDSLLQNVCDKNSSGGNQTCILVLLNKRHHYIPKFIDNDDKENQFQVSSNFSYENKTLSPRPHPKCVMSVDIDEKRKNNNNSNNKQVSGSTDENPIERVTSQKKTINIYNEIEKTKRDKLKMDKIMNFTKKDEYCKTNISTMNKVGNYIDIEIVDSYEQTNKKISPGKDEDILKLSSNMFVQNFNEVDGSGLGEKRNGANSEKLGRYLTGKSSILNKRIFDVGASVLEEDEESDLNEMGFPAANDFMINRIDDFNIDDCFDDEDCMVIVPK